MFYICVVICGEWFGTFTQIISKFAFSKLWTRDCSRVNGEEFVRCQVRANETYSDAKRKFSVRKQDVLMNVHSPHKWSSTLKSAVFCSSSSLPPLVSEGGAWAGV